MWYIIHLDWIQYLKSIRNSFLAASVMGIIVFFINNYLTRIEFNKVLQLIIQVFCGIFIYYIVYAIIDKKYFYFLKKLIINK